MSAFTSVAIHKPAGRPKIYDDYVLGEAWVHVMALAQVWEKPVYQVCKRGGAFFVVLAANMSERGVEGGVDILNLAKQETLRRRFHEFNRFLKAESKLWPGEISPTKKYYLCRVKERAAQMKSTLAAEKKRLKGQK